MAIVVEDGTGLSTAECYISVADADAYFAARGDTVWTALTTAAKEAALRNGAAYMDNTYTWRGIASSSTQALQWPRYGVVDRNGYDIDSDVIPVAVKNANAELAVRASAAALVTDVAPSAFVTSQTVDVISVSYQVGRPQQTSYAAVRNMLKGLIYGGGTVQLVLS